MSLTPKAVRAAARRRPPLGSATPEDVERLREDALTKAELAASEDANRLPPPAVSPAP